MLITRPYALRHDQSERIKDLLPVRQCLVGVTAKDNRLFVEFYTVTELEFLGETYQNGRSDFPLIHTRFCRWVKTGVWERVFHDLARDADNEYAMINATIVRPEQQT